MRLTKRSTGGALLVSLALVLSACASSDPEPGGSDAQPADSESNAGEAEGNDDAGTDEPAGDDGGYTADDVGSGSVRVDGVEYPNYLGDCEISRAFGAEDLGDLSTPGLSLIVAVDNTRSSPEFEANFVMLNERNFRMAGEVGFPAGNGPVDSISFVGPRTSGTGSVDYALVSFAGTTEEGAEVVAELVCEVQTNKY